MKFKRCDDINEHHIDNYTKYTWYGKKEIPNVILTLSNKIIDNDEHVIYLDNLIDYYEEYNTTTGWKVVLVLALMSPQIYELLTKPCIKYYTQAENFWRNADTMNDESFIEPIHHFTNMSIKHKLSAEGDPTRWYITLWNDPVTISKPKSKETKIENVEL